MKDHFQAKQDCMWFIEWSPKSGKYNSLGHLPFPTSIIVDWYKTKMQQVLTYNFNEHKFLLHYLKSKYLSINMYVNNNSIIMHSFILMII